MYQCFVNFQMTGHIILRSRRTDKSGGLPRQYNPDRTLVLVIDLAEKTG